MFQFYQLKKMKVCTNLMIMIVNLNFHLNYFAKVNATIF